MMRYIEIDGKTSSVSCCLDCPVFDDGAGFFDRPAKCRHPGKSDPSISISDRDVVDRCDPECPLRLTKKNSIVYAVFMESGEYYGGDYLIGLFVNEADAQKCKDSQPYPSWCYIEQRKVI